MAREHIPSDTTIRNIKRGDLRKRLNDGAGLYLLLFVKGGSHAWRLDYSINGKRKTLSLGTYPDTGLALARKKAHTARQLVAEGFDPSEQRKAQKQANAVTYEAAARLKRGEAPEDSFEAVAREWYAVKQAEWAASYGAKIIRRLEVDVFPWIGSDYIGGITPPQLLTVLRRIEGRGVIETAHRALENCSQVFRYAVATGRVGSNPARDLKDALKKPEPVHFPAIVDPQRLGQLLRASDAYIGTPVVRAAIKLAPMLLLRPGELRFGEWTEFDLATSTWQIPPGRMKREKRGKLFGSPHIVPLPRQAVAVLKELQPLTGGGKYVFRGERHHDRPMSENTVNAALRAMGFPAEEVTGHGFRATARTLLQERLGVEPDVIEAQLAHSVADSLGRAYNRTQFVEQRRRMMQKWADYLDKLRVGADVLKLPRRKA